MGSASDRRLTGYLLEQPTATPIATVNGRTTTSYAHAQPATGTLTYAIRSRSNSWRSVSTTTTINATLC